MKSIVSFVGVFVVVVVLAKTGFSPEPLIDSVCTWLSAHVGINMVIVPALVLLGFVYSMLHKAFK